MRKPSLTQQLTELSLAYDYQSRELTAAREETAQLRALLAAQILETKAWEHTAQCVRRELKARRCEAMPSPRVPSDLASLAKAYCETHSVKSCSREQAMSMA